MKIELDKLDFRFTSKPLLIGGRAMEYYELRKAGRDVDFVITGEDYEGLSRRYPDHRREIGGDLGVCIYEFEIWKTICLFDYSFLSNDAIEEKEYLVSSLEKLLFMRAIAMKEPKYRRDLELIVERVLQVQYENFTKH